MSTGRLYYLHPWDASYSTHYPKWYWPGEILRIWAIYRIHQWSKCEAWVFLVGSSASTATTLCFLYILFRFPIFIRHVKEEGADPDVVVRLTTFYNLNVSWVHRTARPSIKLQQPLPSWLVQVVRVMFRFLFTIPLFVLAIDGVQGQHDINASPFWSGKSSR
jgi:hypothetical protein